MELTQFTVQDLRTRETQLRLSFAFIFVVFGAVLGFKFRVESHPSPLCWEHSEQDTESRAALSRGAAGGGRSDENSLVTGKGGQGLHCHLPT
jgi:hypothetical protein